MFRILSLLGWPAIPMAFAMHFWIGAGQAWEPMATFLLASLGVVPLAHLMGEATEHLAERTGPTWGGLVNATFGNAAELIIAISALSKGLNEIVKASLSGSIIGNLLLVGGLAMLVGGWGRERQKMSAAAAETNGGLLALAVAAMLLPAIFHVTALQLHDRHLAEHELAISVGSSVILLFVYVLGLVFTLWTHAHIFSAEPHETGDEPLHAWSVQRSVGMLLLAATGIAIVAEVLVGSAEAMAHQLGWTPLFVGVILLAIIGNAAEHSTAIVLARRGDMNTAMTICFQSSLQIALFVTPFLVLLSLVFVALGVGDAQPLDLLFTPMEVVAVFLSVFTVVILTTNGETNWFEGVLLLALYAILALAFFYVPAVAHAG